jgi:hypothetical protein
LDRCYKVVEQTTAHLPYCSLPCSQHLEQLSSFQARLSVIQDLRKEAGGVYKEPLFVPVHYSTPMQGAVIQSPRTPGKMVYC